MTDVVDRIVAADNLSTEDRITALLKTMTPEQRSNLFKLSVPRIVDEYMRHIPHPKQQFFLSLSDKYEVMYGGAAGGGKSDSLLMAASQYVDVPGYSALILRRSWPDLNAPGAILDRAKAWWGGSNVTMRDSGRKFIFPSGARITFGYMQYENDKYKFQSAEYQFVGFDELTQFPASLYNYMHSRIRRPQVPCLNCGAPMAEYDNRWKHKSSSAKCKTPYADPMSQQQYGKSPDGTSVWNIPLRIRSASNPGGIGHEWVYDHFVNPKTKEPSAVFVPAKLTDNPSLDQREYVKALMHLTGIERERLLNGDWEILPAGNMFQRHWFDTVTDVPQGRVERFRAWDLASTEGDGDYTVGALVCRHEDGTWYIEDIIRGQWPPAQTERIIKQTALSDGRNVSIRMEQEPGSSGVTVIELYRRVHLSGYDFDGYKPTGSKALRARPWAVAAENRLVKMVEGQWNRAFINEAELFPTKGAHDDQIDAVSLAFTSIAEVKRVRILA